MDVSFFTSCTVLAEGCRLYEDNMGLTPVVDGYYSDYTDCFQVVSGVITAVSSCTPTPLNCSFIVTAEDITPEPPTVFENVIINVRRRIPSYPPRPTGYDYPSNNSVKLYTSNDNINWVPQFTSALSISFESVLLTIQPGTPLYIGIKHRLPSPPYQPNTYVNTSFGECITGGSYTEPTIVGYGYCGTLPDASFYYGLVPNTDIDLYFEVNINSDAYIECYN